MSAFTDLLLNVFTAPQALLFIGLAGVDYLQTRWFARELGNLAAVGTEEQRAMADGGEPHDE